ncbi:MAG: hypothetical protein PHF84_08990 [bacterium]|nr:hypothetical protein [bacterium]
MKFKNIIIGLLLGLINYLYLSFLFMLTFHYLFRHPFSRFPGPKTSLLLGILTPAIFIIHSLIYCRKISGQEDKFVKRTYKKRIMEFLEFLLHSLLIIGLIFLLLGISKDNSLPFLSAVLLLLLLSSISLSKIFLFFYHIIFTNIFFMAYENFVSSVHKLYKIYEYNEFLVKAQEIINHARRFNLHIGFILLYLPDLLKIADPGHQKFLRKQINFLFTENSRNYEPWSRSPEKNIYLKLLETKSQNEFMEAAERFFTIIKQNQFFILNQQVDLKTKMLNIYLDESYLNSEQNNISETFLPLLNQNLELLKTMKEEVKILVLK